MLVKLRCKSCFAKVSADDDVIGQEVNCPNCNVRFFIPVPQFGFGKVLGGYEIEQFLGSGAMGEVYMARQISMNRPVALKVIKHDISMDAEVVKRFTYEAQTLARLNHPNIVPAFDAGHTDECYFMAMGYIDGETLEDKLKRKGAMDELELLEISLKVIDALEYAWDEFRLLHRDIKPANIMIDQMGEVRIMDMGIAKNTTEDGGLTQAGLVVGTPFFMSPEQAQASTGIDYKSDIYALAATMYQMITGILPFQGPNVMAILAKKVNSPIIPPHEIKPHITSKTSDFILKLLSYKPDKRFEDFPELRQMMRACISAAEKNKDKADKAVKTRHIQMPHEVLQFTETQLMNQKKNPGSGRYKKSSSNKNIICVGILVSIIVLLSIFLMISDDKGSSQAYQNEPSKDTARVDKKALIEMFGEKKPQKIENKASRESLLDFFTERNEYFLRGRGRFEVDNLKSIGSVNFDKNGGLSISEGAYFNATKPPEFHDSFEDKRGFSLYINCYSDVERDQDGVIFSYGKDDSNFNIKLELKNKEIYLITRQLFDEKLKIREQQILKKTDGKIRLFLSYKPGSLTVYRGKNKSFEVNYYSGLMSDWLNFPLSFGANLKGTHNYWRGTIISFALFSSYVDEDKISGLIDFMSGKIPKGTKTRKHDSF